MRKDKSHLAHKFQIFLITCLESALLVLIGTGCIQAQSVTYSGNLQFSTGSYFFTERTESLYFTNGLSISGDRARVSFSIPFIVQNSPWISYGSGGGIPTGGTGHGQVGQQGGASGNQNQNLSHGGRHRLDIPDTVSYRQASFSDPSVHGSLRLYNSPLQNTNLSLNASVKVPFANPASGFGTGAWDFGAGLSLFHRIGTVFLFGDVMYWQMGDMDDLDLNNPTSVSVGAGKAFSEGKWMLNTSISGSTKIVDTVDPPVNMSAGLGYIISSKMSLNGSFSFGLSESSPDFSAGVGWSIQF